MVVIIEIVNTALYSILEFINGVFSGYIINTIKMTLGSPDPSWYVINIFDYTNILCGIPYGILLVSVGMLRKL